MGRKYPLVYDGQWVAPVRKGYRMMCCDCGLVHVVNFKLGRYGDGAKKKIMLQAYRDNRATAAARRKRKAK